MTRAALPLRAAFQPLLDAMAALAFDQPAPAFNQLLMLAFEQAQVDTAHPRYFGVPHGSPSEDAIVGAALAARHNPELASRHHAPFAVAAEKRLVELFAQRFFGSAPASGIVTSGASEAVLSALLSALADKAPAFAKRGIAALPAPARVYASVEAHPSLLKAVRVAGIGEEAVRWIATDARQRMSPAALAQAIGSERRSTTPLLIVATAGTTTSGAIDPLGATADIAEREGCLLHVDAAFGGMLALCDRTRGELAGIERATSVAFDPHKALAVPLGLGLFLTRRPELLARVFAVPARYVPRTKDEPWATSLPWSRGFRGLPLLMELAARGFSGIAQTVERKLALAAELSSMLELRGFRVLTASALPMVCFVDAGPHGSEARHLTQLAVFARKNVGAFVSLVRFADGSPALRATVASDNSSSVDIAALVDALEAGRTAVP